MTIMQDMCPICTEPFGKDEVLVRYISWNAKQQSEKLGHLDCVLYLSNAEKRKHPPTLDERVAIFKKDSSRSFEALAARITKLGG